MKYINKERANLFSKDDPKKVLIELLWGDSVQPIDNESLNGKVLVNTRGVLGYVSEEDLGDTALLELYFIDVGQGDGILIVTPDRKHILIDGGYNRTKQPHGKSAADFVDWKFFKDYLQSKIELDAMISSHCDADHYGGLWDLIDLKKKEDLDTTETIVHDFYHAGISWWSDKEGNRSLGEKEDGFLVSIVEGKGSVKQALKDPNLFLQGEWAKFLQCVVDKDCGIKRIGFNPKQDFDYLPKFGPGENEVQVKILGPVYYRENGTVKVRDLGSSSQNTNGNSILLRLDYGRTRILLTGDLNKKSQQDLLKVFKGKRQELAADVVKACHHGSDDCSYEFLECVQPSATIISSGDDETHSHPRPNIVAAAGATGFRTVEKDEMITPLVFSTEISRSLKMGDPFKLEIGQDVFEDESSVNVHYMTTPSGALRGSKKEKPLNQLKVVDGIVYGLVNVRTDGEKIICATLNEGKYKWEIKSFYSRF
jgi:beta-lactamase superfamily II metal-dependent hydrolase